ncbi:hypothetical protein PGH26_12560 [Sporosarcina jeotgali]|uniref:Uncharacterized protein n=1 Tax=Sporosarcina jeotgali TaxID=3020056 RepID=A0ABZ0KV06_9BACL|nr:hypothetical protein [Sporosarcina sp. B2O-1]WOV83702.1 hypothetical protein PGH26_12560 [Sporosarcina sp. B2O-1]
MIITDNKQSSTLDKWREKYAALVTAFACLIGVMIGWGNNWAFTSILGLGVLVCGTISFFDVKRVIYNKNK